MIEVPTGPDPNPIHVKPCWCDEIRHDAFRRGGPPLSILDQAPTAQRRPDSGSRVGHAGSPWHKGRSHAHAVEPLGEGRTDRGDQPWVEVAAIAS